MRNGLRRRQFLNKVRLFQVLEILGALGLILPTFTDILPIRAPLAAVGSALIQVGAVYSDVRRGDHQKRIMNPFPNRPGSGCVLWAIWKQASFASPTSARANGAIGWQSTTIGAGPHQRASLK